MEEERVPEGEDTMDELQRSAGERNHRLVDAWSLAHVASGIGLVLLLPPVWALAVLVLWEPLEVLVLSPLLAEQGVEFGREALRNSLMDLVFDVVGVATGLLLVEPWLGPVLGVL